MGMLSALVDAYGYLSEGLPEEKKIPKKGWEWRKVSYELALDGDGKLVALFPLRQPVPERKTVQKKSTKKRVGEKAPAKKEKKPRMIPVTRVVPMGNERSASFVPNFLCDNSDYLLGWNEGKPEEKVKEKWKASKLLHEAVLASCKGRAATAVKKFFASWRPDRAEKREDFVREGKDLFMGNFIFSVEGTPVLEDAEVRDAWNRWYEREEEKKAAKCPQLVCGVTGSRLPLAEFHPQIHGIAGGGATEKLVSFNVASSESYGHTRGENAQISVQAAEKYGKALDYLLQSEWNHWSQGDLTVVYWTREERELCGKLVGYAALNKGMEEDDEMDAVSLSAWLQNLKRGKALNYKGKTISYDNPFYLLGLSPNAARLSVRFFYEMSFGDFLWNVREHQERASILPLGNAEDRPKAPPLWALLLAADPPGSGKNKVVKSGLAAKVLQAVWRNAPYPYAWYQMLLLRVHAEEDKDAKDGSRPIVKVSWPRVAALKAVLMKNFGREELKMSLQDELEDTAYLLGRIFAVREKIQEDAAQRPDGASVKATMKATYFDAAGTMPERSFSLLDRLTNHHLQKMANDKQKASWYFRDKKLLEDLSARLPARIPKRLNPEEQGMFIVGYYQQRKALFTKKEEEKGNE